jgi:biotin synthase
MTDQLVEKLRKNRDLSDSELKELIEDPSRDAALTKAADEVRRQWYGDKVYLRGLIEFTSYCKNDCLYCGLRAVNRHAARYRLSKE